MLNLEAEHSPTIQTMRKSQRRRLWFYAVNLIAFFAVLAWTYLK